MFLLKEFNKTYGNKKWEAVDRLRESTWEGEIVAILLENIAREQII